MKNTFNLFAIILFSSFILLTGCNKKDPAVPSEDLQKTRLMKTWVPETAVMFGTPPAADSRFENFEITFGNNTYTASNGAPVFKSSGTWVFKAGSNSSIVVLDNETRLEFVITSLTDSKLNGTINLQGGANARTSGIDGPYVFNLKVKP